MDLLKVINDMVNLLFCNYEVIIVNLGYNYIFILIFVDRNGNLWSVDMFIDILNFDVVSVNYLVKYIFMFCLKKCVG